VITAKQWKEMTTQEILNSIDIALRVLEYEREDLNKESLVDVAKQVIDLL